MPLVSVLAPRSRVRIPANVGCKNYEGVIVKQCSQDCCPTLPDPTGQNSYCETYTVMFEYNHCDVCVRDFTDYCRHEIEEITTVP